MFLENKYTKWYNSIIEKAKKTNRNKKDDVYYESHHIIPKSLGGKEEVLLTAKEHFICHLLLCRMFTGSNKHKMINVLIKMTYSKSDGQKRYTSKSFSLVRKLIAEKNSEMFKGVPKSENVKKNMKGHSGTWKREEKHKKYTSERQKGKPLKWTLLSNEDNDKKIILEKISNKMKHDNPMCNEEYKNKMIQTLKKKKWWTNGIEDIFSESCPEGYINGRSKNRKVK